MCSGGTPRTEVEAIPSGKAELKRRRRMVSIFAPPLATPPADVCPKLDSP